VGLVYCWVNRGGRTGERLEMVAAKAGNYSLVVGMDEINSQVVLIECICCLYFQHYHLILPH